MTNKFFKKPDGTSQEKQKEISDEQVVIDEKLDNKIKEINFDVGNEFSEEEIKNASFEDALEEVRNPSNDKEKTMSEIQNETESKTDVSVSKEQLEKIKSGYASKFLHKDKKENVVKESNSKADKIVSEKESIIEKIEGVAKIATQKEIEEENGEKKMKVDSSIPEKENVENVQRFEPETEEVVENRILKMIGLEKTVEVEEEINRIKLELLREMLYDYYKNKKI